LIKRLIATDPRQLDQILKGTNSLNAKGKRPRRPSHQKRRSAYLYIDDTAGIKKSTTSPSRRNSKAPSAIGPYRVDYIGLITTGEKRSKTSVEVS
jgi:replicative DNA helicase